MRPRVAIAGGGLAGMACALSLARARFPVTLVERSSRLGGKAGGLPADPGREGGFRHPVEHGPHFFAGWYKNVRRLMASTGTLGNLVDYDHLSYLMPPERPGEAARPVVLKLGSHSLPELVANQLHNLFRGPLPWYEMARSGLSAFDLMSARLDRDRPLDEISLVGFLHRRWYADDDLAGVHHTHVLRASALPGHAVSAQTIQTLLRLWFRDATPFLSVLRQDLMEGFVEPLARALGDGVQVRLGTAVEGLRMRGGEVAGLRLAGGEEVEAEVTVSAVPLEVARRFVDDEVYAYDPGLGRLHQLESAPMAALHVEFTEPIAGIPEGVVYLWNSPLSLNLIDLSRVWTRLGDVDGRPPRTVLSLVGSDFKALAHLSEAAQVEALLAELFRYVPAARRDRVASVALRGNREEPLFLNTTGSWANRPDPAGPAYRGGPAGRLYVTGDFARNEADLACMESAALAGLETAAAIARRAGAEPGIPPVPLAPYDPWRILLYRCAKWGCAPAALLARAAAAGRRRAEGS